MKLLVLRVGAQRCALSLQAVHRMVRAVAVTPLPGAPAIVLGAIDVAGSVIPVLDLRLRLRLPRRAVGPDDQFAIVQASRRTVALVVDAAEGVVDAAVDSIVATTDMVPGLEFLRGVVPLDDGLVLIHDLDEFLSLDEARALDEAMAQRDGHVR